MVLAVFHKIKRDGAVWLAKAFMDFIQDNAGDDGQVQRLRLFQGMPV